MAKIELTPEQASVVYTAILLEVYRLEKSHDRFIRPEIAKTLREVAEIIKTAIE